MQTSRFLKPSQSPRHSDNLKPPWGRRSSLRREFVFTIPRSGMDGRKSNSPPCPRKERGDKDGAASLLAYLIDALFQHVHGNIGFFFRHHQRRTQPDRTRPTTEE